MGLDTVELIVKVEDKFQIQILDQEAENIETVGHLVEMVKKKTKQSDQVVFPIIKDILINQMGIPVDQIKYQSHIVYDLGLD